MRVGHTSSDTAESNNQKMIVIFFITTLILTSTSYHSGPTAPDKRGMGVGVGGGGGGLAFYVPLNIFISRQGKDNNERLGNEVL